MTTTLALSKNNTSSNLSNEQKTFNRLKKKIGKLQNDIKSANRTLEENFKIYNNILLPKKQQEQQLLIHFIKLLFNHYKNLNFPKNDKKILKNFILSKVNEVLSNSDPYNPDKEICAILKEFEGIDFQEEVLSQFNELKDSLENIIREQGLDVDLSNIDKFDSLKDLESEILEKIQEARAKINGDEFVSKPKQKTKKELEKEKKIQELESLQKKGLSTIYKQLAKNIHPDLEQNPLKKIEKETLMKRLTHAYDTKDLHAILSLEIECRNYSGSDLSNHAMQSTEQLILLNAIFKKQIENLKKELEAIYRHPRYFPMQKYISKDLLSTLFKLQEDIIETNKLIQEYSWEIKKLSSNNPLPILKAIISDLKKYEKEEMFFY